MRLQRIEKQSAKMYINIFIVSKSPNNGYGHQLEDFSLSLNKKKKEEIIYPTSINSQLKEQQKVPLHSAQKQ